MSDIAKEYFRRYDLACIDLQMQAGVVDSADRVCNLSLKFTPGYQVQFKLQGEAALLGEHVVKISPEGAVDTIDGEASANLENSLETFFKNIEGRLERIAHEERVQSITFPGNTFVLNGKTVFDVLNEEDGRLNIEMYNGDEKRPAMLLASSLLDGLYDGSIVLQGATNPA